jgi:hypothetical protein
MNTGLRGVNALDRQGAVKLAAAIEQYWHDRGRKVTCKVVQATYRNPKKMKDAPQTGDGEPGDDGLPLPHPVQYLALAKCWCVTSDMINGLPRDA